MELIGAIGFIALVAGSNFFMIVFSFRSPWRSSRAGAYMWAYMLLMTVVLDAVFLLDVIDHSDSLEVILGAILWPLTAVAIWTFAIEVIRARRKADKI